MGGTGVEKCLRGLISRPGLRLDSPRENTILGASPKAGGQARQDRRGGALWRHVMTHEEGRQRGESRRERMRRRDFLGYTGKAGAALAAVTRVRVGLVDVRRRLLRSGRCTCWNGAVSSRPRT